MEVDKWGTRKRRAWKFRGISGKKRVISDVGVPWELWTPNVQSHRLPSAKPTPRRILSGASRIGSSPAREGHWLMFFYASLRNALWISRASLRFDLFYTFAFRARGIQTRRSLDAAANVFWDLIEGAEESKGSQRSIRLRQRCVISPRSSIFPGKSEDQRALITMLLFCFPRPQFWFTLASFITLPLFIIIYRCRVVGRETRDIIMNRFLHRVPSKIEFFANSQIITSPTDVTSLPWHAISKLCIFS